MTGNNDAVNESLSALVDGEHSELDLRRVLKAAKSNDAVMDTWASYQLTRQVIKNDLKIKCDDDFLEGVQAAIQDQQAPVVLNSSNASFLRRYAGKVAVAACFTFIFLIGANQWSTQSPETSEARVVTARQTHEPMAVVPAGFELPPLTARTVSSMPGVSAGSQKPVIPSAGQYGASYSRVQQQAALTPAEQVLLEQLMQKHAQASAANSGMSVMPLIRANAVDSTTVSER